MEPAALACDPPRVIVIKKELKKSENMETNGK
jgi:hypothetical protein